MGPDEGTAGTKGARLDEASTVPIAFVREFVKVAGGEAGVDEALRRAGYSPELAADDRTQVSIEQVSRALRDIWRTTGDEFFGLGQHPIKRGTFRMLAIGVVNTSDLASAFDRICEFSRFIPSVPTIVREDAGDGQVRVRLEVREAGLDGVLPAVLLLALVQRFASWVVGRRIDALLVEMPGDQPDDTSPLDLVFAAPLRFGADAPAILFDASLLSAPVTQDEASLEVYLAEFPEVLLSRRGFGTSIDDRVRRILRRRDVVDWPRHEELARALAMSPQTMRRRLREQGTSVAEMKDEIRRDLAIASLEVGDESVSELARRLGFSEPSAFHRAFRRWTGEAPGAYRGRVRG